MEKDEFDDILKRITSSFADTKGKIGASDSDWKIHASELQRISETLDSGGSVTFEELTKVRDIWTSQTPFIDENGNPFVLYIKDHTTVQRFGNFRKFHIAWCDVMDRMERGGRFDRYHKKKDIGNQKFDITLGPGEYMQKALLVCKVCLRHMAETIKPKLFPYTEANFNTAEFFSTWGKQNLKQPTGGFAPVNYPDDWSSISAKKRADKNWTCEQCGKDFVNKSGDLHVHHINGVKGDVRDNNLKVLCVDCHSKQFHHSHMSKKLFNIRDVEKVMLNSNNISTSLQHRMAAFISYPEKYATGTEKAAEKIRLLANEVSENKEKISSLELQRFLDALKIYKSKL